MRRTAVVLTVIALAIGTAGAESTRKIEATLPAADAAGFGVENLAGTMSLVVAPVDAVTVVATVHAESAELAEAVRIDTVRGKDGRPILRVIYPTDRIRTFRYPGGTGTSFFGHDTTNTRYGDEKVSVSSHRGTLLWAAVEIRVPSTAIDGHLRNVVGALSAKDARGTLTLDTGSGDVVTENLDGKITADTGSGDVVARKLHGTFSCDTGSGDCRIEEFDGDGISCDTGSGDVTVTAARATRIAVDTGSGSVRVEGADVERFSGDTGSGDVIFAAAGSRLHSIDANTGSGDVRLKLPAAAGFTLKFDGSGDLRCGFRDATALVRHREVIGYERGDKAISITVDTGSGDVVLDPSS